MKILQIIPQYIPAYRFGGPLRVAHSIGNALVEKGHSVTVITTNMATEDADLDVPIDKPVFIDGIKVFYNKVKYLRSWGFCPEMKNRINKEIKNADFVFSHFHYQYASILAGRLARKANIPLIIFSHGSLNKYGINKRKHLLKHLYIKIFESNNFLNAEFIAFNCEEELGLSLYNKKGKVIYNGISINQFGGLPEKGSYRKKNAELKDKLIYLFLGRLNYTQKGINILLPAFKKLTIKNKLTHLILVGPDELHGESKIKSEINKLGLNKYITMTGELNDKEKLGVLVDADVFVLPSPSEGTSIALLEALYMNIPIITTKGVGLNKVIENRNAGYIVNSDKEELASALVKISSNDVRYKMIGNGRDIILENHIMDKIVHQLIKELDKIKEKYC